nr:MAG TPA: hypothetical protein [Caudoviricetes sp.]
MADEPLVTHAPPPIGAVTVAGGLSKSEVEAIVNNHINSLQQPAPAVDESKIRSIVQAEVQKIPQTPGVNEAKVQELIHSAISQLPPAQSGITEQQVNTIVQKAIAAIPPASGVDEAKVTQLIQQEIAKLPPTPEGGLSAAQVQSAIQTALTEASKTIKSETLAEVEPKIATAKTEAISEAKKATDTAIAAIPPVEPGVNEAKVREIVDGKVPTITDNGDGTLTITTKEA